MCTFRRVFFFCFFPFLSQFSCRQTRPNKERGVELFNPDTLLKNVNEVGQTSLDRTLDSRLSRLLKICSISSLLSPAESQRLCQMLASFLSPISHPSRASHCVRKRYCFCRRCLLARLQRLECLLPNAESNPGCSGVSTRLRLYSTQRDSIEGRKKMHIKYPP